GELSDEARRGEAGPRPGGGPPLPAPERGPVDGGRADLRGAEGGGGDDGGEGDLERERPAGAARPRHPRPRGPSPRQREAVRGGPPRLRPGRGAGPGEVGRALDRGRPSGQGRPRGSAALQGVRSGLRPLEAELLLDELEAPLELRVALQALLELAAQVLERLRALLLAGRPLLQDLDRRQEVVQVLPDRGAFLPQLLDPHLRRRHALLEVRDLLL